MSVRHFPEPRATPVLLVLEGGGGEILRLQDEVHDRERRKLVLWVVYIDEVHHLVLLVPVEENQLFLHLPAVGREVLAPATLLYLSNRELGNLCRFSEEVKGARCRELPFSDLHEHRVLVPFDRFLMLPEEGEGGHFLSRQDDEGRRLLIRERHERGG